MKASGVYVIRCKVNQKVYVGATCDFKRRKNEHCKELRNCKHHNLVLQSDWSEYGEASFEFELVKTVQSNLVEAEIEVISQLNATDAGCGYNEKVGNSFSQKMKSEVSQRLLGNQFAKGVEFSSERRANLSLRLKGNTARRGKKDSEATRELKRVAATGKKPSAETRIKLSQPRIPCKPSTKSNISKSIKAGWSLHHPEHMEEITKLRLSEALKLSWAKRKAEKQTLKSNLLKRMPH